MSDAKTHTLAVPGAVLTYDVRPTGSGAEPVLLMIGSPMGAAGFGTLAGYFSDRTVVTYDPAEWSAASAPTAHPSLRPTSTPTTCTG